MKGIAFTLIILIALVPIVTLLLLDITQQASRREITNSIKISEMQNLYNSITNDYYKFVQISLPRAISAAINYDIETGEGLDDTALRLQELAVNGSLYGVQENLMNGSTFHDWTNKINTVASTKGFVTNISISSISIKPFDSWNILVSVNLTINITDLDGNFAIVRNATLERQLPITGFEDPAYTLNTLGRALNIIQKSPYIGNYTTLIVSGVSSSSWFYGTAVVFPKSNQAGISAITNKNTKVLVTDDISGIENLANSFGAVVIQNPSSGITVPRVDNAPNAMTLVPNNTNILVDAVNGRVWYIDNLKDDISKQYYHPSLNGGSFLDRLEGKLTVQSKYQAQTLNVIGLDSFVDKDFLSQQGLNPNTAQTNIDYLFFSSTVYAAYKVKGVEGSFRMDLQNDLEGKTHADIYNVSQLLE